jgi:hypothetical protein
MVNPSAEKKTTVGYAYNGAFNNGDPFIPDLSLGGVAAMGHEPFVDPASHVVPPDHGTPSSRHTASAL